MSGNERNERFHLLDAIPFEPRPQLLLSKLRTGSGEDFHEELERLCAEAGGLARPRAYYHLAYPRLLDGDRVEVDGVQLRSRILRVNLEDARRIFVYVATCGMELEEWSRTKTDPLEQYWADAIKEQALGVALQAFNRDLVTRYRPGQTSAMAPGSLADWPLEQQQPLFEILRDVEACTGVQLSPSFLMIPNKSVSGIRFPHQESFESCMLCPRPDCPGRRAPYDPALYQREYGMDGADPHAGNQKPDTP